MFARFAILTLILWIVAGNVAAVVPYEIVGLGTFGGPDSQAYGVKKIAPNGARVLREAGRSADTSARRASAGAHGALPDSAQGGRAADRGSAGALH
jgi:hypothetical protein